MQNNSDRTADSDYVHYKIQNGILYAKFKNLKGKITLLIAKEIVRVRLELIGEESYPTLVDMLGVTQLDREAREYFSTAEAKKGIVSATTDPIRRIFFTQQSYRATRSSSGSRVDRIPDYKI